jgi:hypothetical protein
VRSVIGQSVFKVSTGEGDKHRAAEKSLIIIAGLKRRIDTACATLEPSEKTQAGFWLRGIASFTGLKWLDLCWKTWCSSS